MTNKDRKNKVIQRQGNKGTEDRMTKKTKNNDIEKLLCQALPQLTVTDRREAKREGVNSKISFRLVDKLTN